MRVLVCGGRNFNDTALLVKTLSQYDIELLIHGGCRGADLLASVWAKENHIPQIVFEAKWDLLGKNAGPIRNQKMLDEGKPGLVVAFPGGSGTADMVRRAKAARVRVCFAFDGETKHG